MDFVHVQGNEVKNKIFKITAFKIKELKLTLTKFSETENTFIRIFTQTCNQRHERQGNQRKSMYLFFPPS